MKSGKAFSKLKLYWKMIKILRKRIFARIALFYLVLTTTLSLHQAHAQFVVQDPLNLVENAITAAATFVTEIAQVAETWQNLQFYTYLKSATNAIKTYHKGVEVISSSQRILASVQENLQLLKNYKALSPAQIKGMSEMYVHFARETVNHAEELKNIFKPEFYQLSDAERMDMIDGIAADLNKLDELLVYYNIQNSTLAAEQQRKQTDLNTLNSFYAAKTAAKVSETQAASSIGSLYGNIVNVLYGLSALVALVGSVKVYSQFALGDGRVVETASSWFGAVLLSVLFTTFISFLFF
jgi:hypothetical protein